MDSALAQMCEAVTSPDGKVKVVQTISLSSGKSMTGLQVYLKTRKIGPILFPADGQTVGDCLDLLLSAAGKVEATDDVRRWPEDGMCGHEASDGARCVEPEGHAIGVDFVRNPHRYLWPKGHPQIGVKP